MADPGKDKNRKKIKIEHGKLIFRPQQKQQQTYPSLLLLQSRPKKQEMEIKHTNANLPPAQINGRSR